MSKFVRDKRCNDYVTISRHLVSALAGWTFKCMECMPKHVASPSDTPSSSKVAENEGMSEPELKKKIQKKSCREFFSEPIFLFMTFFFEQKIFFEKIFFHEKIQTFSEKNREKIQKFYSQKWIFSRRKNSFFGSKIFGFFSRFFWEFVLIFS